MWSDIIILDIILYHSFHKIKMVGKLFVTYYCTHLQHTHLYKCIYLIVENDVLERMELMYPMPTPQMPPIAPGASMLTRGMFQGGAVNQLSSLPLQQGVMGQSGGILSKLLGGAQAGGGGFTNILGMLQNAQKAIGVFQQVSPMVQQYAPFVKSLPALISMMRNSSSSESGDDETASVEENSVKQQVKKSKKKSQKKTITKTKDKKSPSTSKKLTTLPSEKSSSMEIARGLPAPKLYI
jgi:hypothetical protein